MMTGRRIIVTGVGGAPGFDLARALLRLGQRVTAADANPLSAGLHLPEALPVVLPAADSPAFDDQLLTLCRERSAEAVISCVEAELPRLLALRSALAASGVRVWLPPAAAVEACGDKARFAAVLAQHAIPTPRTWLPEQIDTIPEGLPLVVKPRHEHGSQGITYCTSRNEAKILCRLTADPLVQERIDGDEFTADCLVDHNARASVVVRRRLLVKGGLSMVSETVHDPEITGLVKAALTAVGAEGVCCMQGFTRAGEEPRVLLTEANARIAGGFPLAEAAGADLVAQLIAGLFEQPVDHARLHYKPGVRLTRYVETLRIGGNR